MILKFQPAGMSMKYSRSKFALIEFSHESEKKPTE